MAEILSLTPISVLLVDDNAADAAFITDLLSQPHAEDCAITYAASLNEALDCLREKEYQMLLLDLSLPDAEGLEGLQHIHNLAPELAVVVLTGRNDEALALSAVERGAQDYLTKDKADAGILRRAIRYAIQRKQVESGIIRQANFDALTGLANRTLFEGRLEMALARAKRMEMGIGVFFLDLNGFKDINDRFGHAAGDCLLKEFSWRLTQCLRPYDTAARFGGDEFALLIEGIIAPRDCVAVAQKILERMAEPFIIQGQHVMAGVSIGIAARCDHEKLSGEQLLKQADGAMYHAKESSSSTYQFYTEDLNREQHLRQQLGRDLRDAVYGEGLSLCYQPRQSLTNGRMSGAEALLRWNHPQRGMLLPGEFIALAEECGLMCEIGEWTITTVCQDMQRWKKQKLPSLQVSVNISEVQCDTPGFVEFLSSTIQRYDVFPADLMLEVPESLFLSLTEARERTLTRLHQMGVVLGLDRFGSNIASLHTLHNALLSVLKLDTVFTRDLQGSPENMRLAKAIIACAHQLGLQVVASGVESDWLRTCLRASQCDGLQGFIYGRPMPAHYLEEWVQAKRSSAPVTVSSRLRRPKR